MPFIRAAIAACLVSCGAAFTQDAAPQQPSDKGPKIKLNFLNVCTPSDAEKQEIASALNKVPAKVSYSGDFEVTRGRTINEKEGPSKYVRLRREVIGDPTFNNVLYALSSDAKNTTETLVFKAKDPKELVLVSIEDQISAGAAKPAELLETDTPANHIKLERFGKTSIALARCENDQSAYEPLFAQATKLIASYRRTLGLRTMFRSDLTWLALPESPANDKPRSAAPKASSETKPAGKHLN